MIRTASENCYIKAESMVIQYENIFIVERYKTGVSAVIKILIIFNPNRMISCAIWITE